GVQEGSMSKDLLVDLAIRYGFQVLGALVILGVGAVIAACVGRITDQRLQARAMEPPLRMLAVRTLRLVVMLFAVVVALDKFGFQIAPLVAGIGVIGLGIGIALQGVIGNLVGGGGRRVRVFPPTRRHLTLSVTLPHGPALSAALATVDDIAQRNPRVLKDPSPVIGVGQVLD